MAVTLSNVFIFPRGQMFTKLTFYSIPSLNFFNQIILTPILIVYIAFIDINVINSISPTNNWWEKIRFNQPFDLVSVVTILFAERKFYDANLVLDSFQNRVLKTHLNFTSLSSESWVPSFFMLFASTQLPIFTYIHSRWNESVSMYRPKNYACSKRCNLLEISKFRSTL